MGQHTAASSTLRCCCKLIEIGYSHFGNGDKWYIWYHPGNLQQSKKIEPLSLSPLQALQIRAHPTSCLYQRFPSVFKSWSQFGTVLWCFYANLESTNDIIACKITYRERLYSSSLWLLLQLDLLECLSDCFLSPRPYPGRREVLHAGHPLPWWRPPYFWLHPCVGSHVRQAGEES